MKKIIFVCLMLMGLAGCKDLFNDTSGSASSKSITNFEIRDLSFNTEEKDYGGRVVNGRGTLVVRDDSYKKGTLLVILSAKRSHEGDQDWNTQVLVRDGIGTITTYAYMTSKESDKEVTYHDWKVVGFIPLQPGTLAQPGQ